MQRLVPRGPASWSASQVRSNTGSHLGRPSPPASCPLRLGGFGSRVVLADDCQGGVFRCQAPFQHMAWATPAAGLVLQTVGAVSFDAKRPFSSACPARVRLIWVAVFPLPFPRPAVHPSRGRWPLSAPSGGLKGIARNPRPGVFAALSPWVAVRRIQADRPA